MKTIWTFFLFAKRHFCNLIAVDHTQSRNYNQYNVIFCCTIIHLSCPVEIKSVAVTCSTVLVYTRIWVRISVSVSCLLKAKRKSNELKHKTSGFLFFFFWSTCMPSPQWLKSFAIQWIKWKCAIATAKSLLRMLGQSSRAVQVFNEKVKIAPCSSELAFVPLPAEESGDFLQHCCPFAVVSYSRYLDTFLWHYVRNQK